MTTSASLRHFRPGVYRRRIRTAAIAGVVRADLEDDLHRYGVVLRHDGRRVSSIEGIPIRVPWSLCGEAAQVLDRLVGMPLSPNSIEVYRYANGKLQCTHMFDLAGLAAAHAARGISRRQYDIEAPCLAESGPRVVTLSRNGEQVLSWTLEGTMLLAPEPFVGRDLRHLLPWAEQVFHDADKFEAVAVLRRAVMISGSRWHDLDSYPHAQATGHGLGACYVFRPELAEHALRMIGSAQDFTHAPDQLLADLANETDYPLAGSSKEE